MRNYNPKNKYLGNVLVAINDLRKIFDKSYKGNLKLMLNDFLNKGYSDLPNIINIKKLDTLENKELANKLRDLIISY